MVSYGIPGMIITPIHRCLEQPVHPAQGPGDAPQATNMLDAGQALLPWVADLQHGVTELRGMLADTAAKELQLEVSLPRATSLHGTRLLYHTHASLWLDRRLRDCDGCAA